MDQNPQYSRIRKRGADVRPVLRGSASISPVVLRVEWTWNPPQASVTFELRLRPESALVDRCSAALRCDDTNNSHPEESRPISFAQTRSMRVSCRHATSSRSEAQTEGCKRWQPA